MALDDVTLAKINGSEIASMKFNGSEIWPPQYNKVNYLKSDNSQNSGQYINLNVSNLTNGSVAEFEMMFDNVNANFSYIYGAEDAYPYRRVYLKRNNAYSVSNFELGAYGYKNFTTNLVSVGTKFKVKVSTLKGNSYVYINDVLQTSDSNSDDRTANTYGLFAIIRNGSFMESNFIGKIYWFKLYDSNNNLIRDLVPVLDENDVPCMYDKVSKTHFYNQGTGTFLYG